VQAAAAALSGDFDFGGDENGAAGVSAGAGAVDDGVADPFAF